MTKNFTLISPNVWLCIELNDLLAEITRYMVYENPEGYYVAGENITDGDVVMVVGGLIYKAVQSTSTNFNKSIGIANVTGITGDYIEVLSTGEYIKYSGLTIGSLYYNSTTVNGGITSTQPQNNTQIVGIAKTATILTIDIKSAVIPLNNQRTIKSVSDFPTPAANVITLEDNITYLINGSVDIGVNRFICGVKNTFIGLDRVNDKLTSTTTGVMFTMDGTTTTKTNILFSNLTIGAPNGTLLNVLSSTANQAVGMIDLTISATGTLGTINNITTWAMTNIVVRSCATTNGFTITGANGTVKCRLGVFSNNVGTTFNFGTSTCAVIDFNNNQIDESVSQIFISGTTGGANVTTGGKLNDNIFSGAGTYIQTITTQDSLWNFIDNVGTANSMTLIISDTQPSNPVENTIWFKPT